MQIFAGSASQKLGKNIALLGKVRLEKFQNGESRVQILEEKVDVEVALLQSLSDPTNDRLVEFCLLADALRRKGAKEIVGIVPWLGYSKQDKVFLPGEALGAKVIAKILQTAGITKLITFDLHNRAILGFFDIPVMELSAKPLFLEYLQQNISANVAVVAPDEGAVKSSGYFARELGVPIVYMDKRRDLVTGEVMVVGMSGDVTGKEIVIVDDMIVTGSTIIETAKYLKTKGAKKVSVCATHHLFVPGAQEKLEESEIDEVVISDSVEGTETDKLKVLSVAKMIAENLT
ncbi:MAG: ribose-phosphate pyrophosphokinase [bacterium]